MTEPIPMPVPVPQPSPNSRRYIGALLATVAMVALLLTVVAAAILSSVPGRTTSLRHIQTPASAAPPVRDGDTAYPPVAAALAGHPGWISPLPGTCRPSYGGGQWHAPRSGYLHQGIDLGGWPTRKPYGAVILAVRGGTVTFAGWNGNAGRQVVINHGDGWTSRYNHLSYINVRYGQRVLQGNHIGSLGASGNATGPHLHIELRLNGIPQDPTDILSVAC